MESAKDKKDPRRLLVIQDAKTTSLWRDAFSTREVVEGGLTAVSYVTPTRCYTYERVRPGSDE